jgi:ABC-type microcin C transport system permease subunit YejE
MSFLSPVNQARWARFRHNRRGYWSLWLFMLLFLCSLCAELIANDRPLLVQYRGSLYVPALKNYSETTFGGRLLPPPTIRIRGCKSSWMITAGYCGRRSIWRHHYRLRHPDALPSRPQRETGWVPMPTAAMCWRVFYTARAYRFCLACC